ncbi:MAG: DUF5615 family PIN-like protein [Acidobacteriota bacterium]|nr:DUF5615 family PIN-like protein [Acidobacteriota bacterium]
MRLLVDESTGPKVAQWLREQTHQVVSVYEEAGRMDDDDIIQKAFAESWILATSPTAAAVRRRAFPASRTTRDSHALSA